MATKVQTITRNESTSNVLSNEAKTFYEKNLLKRLLPNLVFAKYGQKKALPKRNGKTIEFRKFASLGSKEGSPLSEGVTPDGNNLSVSAITCTVSQYGDYVMVSDELDLAGIDPVITEATDILGEQAGLTFDHVVRDIICAGTNVQFVDGANNTNKWQLEATDKLTATEIKKAVRTLKKANAKGVENGFYICVVDPDIAFDLMSDSLWQDVSKYNGGEAILKGEIGKLCGVKFIETTEVLTKVGDLSFTSKTVAQGGSVEGLYSKDASKTGEIGSSTARYTKQTGTSQAGGTFYEMNSARVHCALLIGANAYGVVDIENGSKPEVFVEKDGGTTDPLHQRRTVGWKLNGTAVILNQDALVRIECGVTA